MEFSIAMADAVKTGRKTQKLYTGKKPRRVETLRQIGDLSLAFGAVTVIAGDKDFSFVSFTQTKNCFYQGRFANAVEANYEQGVLTLTVPKAEEVKPKRIAIKANGNQ